MFGLHSLHGLRGLHDNERIGISLSCISDLPCFRSVHGLSLSFSWNFETKHFNDFTKFISYTILSLKLAPYQNK